MQSTSQGLPAHSKHRCSRKAEYLWAVVILALAGWFYFWTATSAGSPLTWKLQKDDLYNRLADGFLAGRLSFVEPPDPALAKLSDPWDPAQNAPFAHFHDVTYYEGKYYLYFGAAPALVLLVPWKLITGTYLGQNLAAAFFGWLGAAAGVAVILCLKRRHFPNLPAWVAGTCLTMAAFGNFVPVLLRRPVYYELAIASASAFGLSAILFVFLAQEAAHLRRVYLVLAGLAYGLTIGSRPNYFFGAIILVLPLLPALRNWWACAEVDWRNFRRDAMAVAAPFLALLGLILIYNGLRFGRITEFGTSYMLAGQHPQRDVVTSVRFLPVNLWFYLFARSQWVAYFPFFEVIRLPWFSFPSGYSGEEDVYGVITNLPFFWMLALLPRLLRDRSLPDLGGLRDWVLVVLSLVGFNLLVLCRIAGASNRYMVDLLPPLVPLSCLGIFYLEAKGSTGLRRLVFRIFWLALVVFTGVFNVLVSFQHNDLLKYYNPVVYYRLAHTLDHIPNWLGASAPEKIGPVDLIIRFPANRTGRLEPLLVTGLSFRADFIYVYYTDKSHLQIGFEHTSYGGPITKPPVEIDYAVPHTLHLELGSLYPPIESEFYDDISAHRIALLKHRLRVVLDGKEIIVGDYDFYESSPGDVSIGHNPVSDAFGSRFSGKIIRAVRSGPAAGH